jgi:hypothetical protein
MGPILQFIRPHDVFNTETLTVLNNAYEKAIVSVRDDHGHPAVAREAIAVRILDLGAMGERCVNLLVQEALIALGNTLSVIDGARSQDQGSATGENPL